MTAAPAGQSKAASENTDAAVNAAAKPRAQRTPKEQAKVTKAVTNAENTDKGARVTTSGSAAEGEVLPKAEPESTSQPGDETRRPAEDDNATPTGVERSENDPDKHPVETEAEHDEYDEPTKYDRLDNPDTVPDAFESPLGLDADAESKIDKLKDRNIEDLEQGTPGVSELPEYVPAPNAFVPEGEVEITRNAKKGEPSDPSGKVTERKDTGRRRSPKKDAFVELTDLTQLPIAAAVGQVTAGVRVHNGIALFELSLRGWVGEAPFQIPVKDIGELEQVISELRSQLS